MNKINIGKPRLLLSIFDNTLIKPKSNALVYHICKRYRRLAINQFNVYRKRFVQPTIGEGCNCLKKK